MIVVSIDAKFRPEDFKERFMRTTFTLLTVILTFAGVTPSPADTVRKKHRGHETTAERTLRPTVTDSAEHDRAQGCDPAGQYAGYPDWARVAFSCGSGRR